MAQNENDAVADQVVEVPQTPEAVFTFNETNPDGIHEEHCFQEHQTPELFHEALTKSIQGLRSKRRETWLITLGRLDLWGQDRLLAMWKSDSGRDWFDSLCLNGSITSYTAAFEHEPDSDQSCNKHPHLHIAVSWTKQVCASKMLRMMHERMSDMVTKETWYQSNIDFAMKGVPGVDRKHAYLLVDTGKKQLDPEPYVWMPNKTRDEAIAHWVEAAAHRDEANAFLSVMNDETNASKVWTALFDAAETCKTEGRDFKEYLLTDEVALVSAKHFTLVREVWDRTPAPREERYQKPMYTLDQFHPNYVGCLDAWFDEAYDQDKERMRKGSVLYLYGPPNYGKSAMVHAWVHERGHSHVRVSENVKEWSSHDKEAMMDADVVIWEECEAIGNATKLDAFLKLFFEGAECLLPTKYGKAIKTWCKRLIITSNTAPCHDAAIQTRLFPMELNDPFWKEFVPEMHERKGYALKGGEVSDYTLTDASRAFKKRKFAEAVETQVYNNTVRRGAQTRNLEPRIDSELLHEHNAHMEDN